MSRYIDKETMRGIIREQEKSHGIRGLAWIEMAMDKQEDADVQEVRHGHWNTINSKVAQCSVCGVSRDIRTQVGWNFCPVCGAKMGEEVEDERR